MKSLSCLRNIIKVEQSNNVSVAFCFNDDFHLLVEGSFRILESNNVVFTSEAYMASDFNLVLLDQLRKLVLSKDIERALISPDNAELILHFSDNTALEVFYDEEDFSLWELLKGTRALYASQGKGLVSYEVWDVT